MNNERFKSTIGFTDLLFNILVGFAFLFIVAFLLIKPEAKQKDFDRRAEYVIVMEWDKEATDDIDLYLADPLGDIASYQNPTVNFTHLDKDDLGSRNDETYLPNGKKIRVDINREVMTIRGILPGEWIVNAHYYSTHDYNNSKAKDYYITVRVELHQVNPYAILWLGEKKFNRKGQEETFLRFTLDKNGKVKYPLSFLKKRFVLYNLPDSQPTNPSEGS